MRGRSVRRFGRHATWSDGPRIFLLVESAGLVWVGRRPRRQQRMIWRLWTDELRRFEEAHSANGFVALVGSGKRAHTLAQIRAGTGDSGCRVDRRQGRPWNSEGHYWRLDADGNCI